MAEIAGSVIIKVSSIYTYIYIYIYWWWCDDNRTSYFSHSLLLSLYVSGWIHKCIPILISKELFIIWCGQHSLIYYVYFLKPLSTTSFHLQLDLNIHILDRISTCVTYIKWKWYPFIIVYSLQRMEDITNHTAIYYALVQKNSILFI